MPSTILNTDLRTLARRYAADPNLWPMAPRFSPTERWYARIATAEDHEAWLLTWLPGQRTDLHDHGGSAGAFQVVQGTLTEFTPAPGTLAGRTLGTGEIRGFGRRHIHQIVNTGMDPAISVHVYAPALIQMTRYDLRDGRLVTRAVERAGADW